MTKLIQRIKNWLIKKLGGYTKAEYDLTRTQTPHIRETAHSVKTLVAMCPVYVPLSGEPNSDRRIQNSVKASLNYDIIRMALEYVEYEYSDRIPGGFREARAILRVVK